VVRRTSQADLKAAAKTALAAALSENSDATLDAAGIEIPGRPPVPVEILGAHTVSMPVPARYTAARPGTVTIVVAEVITDGARAVLDAAGTNWLDRRGHLKLTAPGMIINTDIGPRSRRPDRLDDLDRPLRGRAGLAVAVDALWHTALGEVPGKINRIARMAGLTHPPVSLAAKRLRDAGLLGDNGGRVPELFWATVELWRPHWIDLATVPERHGAEGLVAGGTRAAIHHGIPIAATDDYPWELYAPTEDVAAMAQIRYAGPGPVLARVAAIPTPLGLCDSVDSGGRFPFVNPLIAALDLATDPSRGTEALTAWQPGEIRRVW
jgi:hypothetical protein